VAKIQNVFSKLAILKRTNMISYHRVQNDEELYEILELQRRNLPTNLGDNELHEEGFVTVQHTFDILKEMNEVCAHCIAKEENYLVGYALCMDRRYKNQIEVLKPMFEEIETAINNQSSKLSNYVVMGQICIDKKYRKKGVFRGLYSYLREQLNTEYSCIITEVDQKNSRSSNAHKAVGFEVMKTYLADTKIWELIVLKL
jgi:hypothetical protein